MDHGPRDEQHGDDPGDIPGHLSGDDSGDDSGDVSGDHPQQPVESSMGEWWYRTPGGDLYGPFTSDELRRYAGEGRIEAAGSIRAGMNGDWVDPSSVSIIASLGSGAAAAPPTHRVPPRTIDTSVAEVSRAAYILLALLPFLLFAIAGIHNLVVGRTAMGLVQLVLSLILFWGVGCAGSIVGGLGMLVAIPTWIGLLVWTIVDVASVTVDGDGRPFRS